MTEEGATTVIVHRIKAQDLGVVVDGRVRIRV
jgi:hypothetical protein